MKAARRLRPEPFDNDQMRLVVRRALIGTQLAVRNGLIRARVASPARSAVGGAGDAARFAHDPEVAAKAIGVLVSRRERHARSSCAGIHGAARGHGGP